MSHFTPGSRCFTWNHTVNLLQIMFHVWPIFRWELSREKGKQKQNVDLLECEALKPLDPFDTEKKKKNHRFTNNLQGLQKVMVKDFSWNISPWKALLFEKTVKQYKFSIARITYLLYDTCHDTAKRAKTGVGFPVIFSRLQCPIEPKYPQDCYFIYKLWYTKCGTWTILFTESV